MFPVGLAWFIYIAAEEELDFFSFPMILRSVVKDIAVFVGLGKPSIFTAVDRSASPLRQECMKIQVIDQIYIERTAIFQFRQRLPIPVERV